MTGIASVIIAAVSFGRTRKLRETGSGEYLAGVKKLRTAQIVFLSICAMMFFMLAVFSIWFIIFASIINGVVDPGSYYYYDGVYMSMEDAEIFNIVAVSVYALTAVEAAGVVFGIISVVKSSKAISAFARLNPRYNPSTPTAYSVSAQQTPVQTEPQFKYCVACGKKIDAHARFCVNCGSNQNLSF